MKKALFVFRRLHSLRCVLLLPLLLQRPKVWRARKMDTTLVPICISIVTTGQRKRGRLSPWIPPRDGQSRRLPLEREHLLRPVEANCISHSGNAFMSHIARSRSIVVTARSKEDQSKIGTAPSQQRGRKGETREEGSIDRERECGSGDR